MSEVRLGMRALLQLTDSLVASYFGVAVQQPGQPLHMRRLSQSLCTCIDRAALTDQLLKRLDGRDDDGLEVWVEEVGLLLVFVELGWQG